jgi:hypothetical protein
VKEQLAKEKLENAGAGVPRAELVEIRI